MNDEVTYQPRIRQKNTSDGKLLDSWVLAVENDSHDADSFETVHDAMQVAADFIAANAADNVEVDDWIRRLYIVELTTRLCVIDDNDLFRMSQRIKDESNA